MILVGRSRIQIIFQGRSWFWVFFREFTWIRKPDCYNPSGSTGIFVLRPRIRSLQDKFLVSKLMNYAQFLAQSVQMYVFAIKVDMSLAP